MTRIDEIRERLDKATPGVAMLDGSHKAHENPKSAYAWTFQGKLADAVLLIHAHDDIRCLLDSIKDRDALIERLSARIARHEPRYHARTMALIKIRGLARQAGLTEIQGLANESLTTISNTKEN